LKFEPIKVADECWVALAALSKERPDRAGFSRREILERIRLQGAHPELRPGVQIHIQQHNVANYPPNAARYRMFYRLADGTYRLFRPGDSYHPSRGGKTHPNRGDLPAKYHTLLDWYEREYCGGKTLVEDDPILKMWGLGREIWKGVDPDAYVAELRADWNAEEPVAALKPARATREKYTAGRRQRIPR
jgi:hypothetical protein